MVADGKERRVFGGREYLLEQAIRADFAFVKGERADRHGNLVYRRGARNLHPAFATGAGTTIAEVNDVVEAGALDPETNTLRAEIDLPNPEGKLLPGMSVQVGITRAQE